MSLDTVALCCHEEADTRIFVHARDTILGCSKSVIIKANDTDVVIIAVPTAAWSSEHLDCFWSRSQCTVDSSS